LEPESGHVGFVVDKNFVHFRIVFRYETKFRIIIGGICKSV
jgi:hypothetical protein